MKIITFFVIVPLFCACAQGQSGNMGTVEVYRIGRMSVAFPLIVDSQCTLKLSHSARLVLTLTPGEHQIESKLGKDNPVLAIHVEPGKTTYIVMDYEHASMGKMIFRGVNPTQDLTLTLEHTNAPPEGNFKDEKIDNSLSAKLDSLPPYHEESPQDKTPEIQLLSDEEISLLSG